MGGFFSMEREAPIHGGVINSRNNRRNNTTNTVRMNGATAPHMNVNTRGKNIEKGYNIGVEVNSQAGGRSRRNRKRSRSNRRSTRK